MSKILENVTGYEPKGFNRTKRGCYKKSSETCALYFNAEIQKVLKIPIALTGKLYM